jgi:hypothetical protein
VLVWLALMLIFSARERLPRELVPHAVAKESGEDHAAALRCRVDNIAARAGRMFWQLSWVQPSLVAEQRGSSRFCGSRDRYPEPVIDFGGERVS